MTNGDNRSDFILSENIPQREELLRVFRAIDLNDEETARKIIVSKNINVANIPTVFRKKLLSRYGRYMTFGEFFDEYEEKLGLERREYTRYELLKLASILTEGRGTRVKQSFYLSMYYLARLFYDTYKDQEIYVLNMPSEEEEKRGFEHFLKGSDMHRAKTELKSLVSMGYSQAMKPLSKVLSMLDERDEALYWSRLSKLYEPLSYGHPMTTFAAALQGRFSALDQLSRLSDTKYSGDVFQKPKKIKAIIDTWMVRYYEQLAYDGNSTALWYLADYYGDKENDSEHSRYLSAACSMGCGFAMEEQYTDIMLKLSTSLIGDQTLSESELDRAQYLYESAVSVGVVRIEAEKKTLKAYQKKFNQYSYNRAASSAATASAMNAYRQKLDSREEWRNFFMTGAALTDEQMGMLGLVLKNTDLMEYAALSQAARRHDEAKYQQTIIERQLDEERRKDIKSHLGETSSMVDVRDRSEHFEAERSAFDVGLNTMGDEGYDLSSLSMEEYAASLFCPCCGRRMTGNKDIFSCRCCHTFVRVPSENRELFIRYYNLMHMCRQNGSFYEAMGYADQMAQHFPTLPDGYWARMIARLGVVFVEGTYLYHINRYTADTLMYDEDFLKLMELTEGQEKAWYYEMEEDFSDTLRDYKEMANRTKGKWQRHFLLSYAKEDRLACEYAERFKREADPSTEILDANDLSAGCDIDDEAIICYGVKSCRALLLIASSHEYFVSCSNIFIRFLEHSRTHSGRVLIPIATGGEEGIFDGVFKNKAKFTDRDDVKFVEAAVLKKLSESDDRNPYLICDHNTPGSGVIRRLNQWRHSLGLEEKPAHSSSERIKTIEIEVKEPEVFNTLQDRLVNYFCLNSRGQFVIRVTLRNQFTQYSDVEINTYVYDQDDNLVYCNEGKMRFAPGEDLYMLTFNQGDTDGKPFLREDCAYYVALRYEDEWVYTGFYVASSRERRYLRDIANILDVTLPKEARGLSKEERERAWLNKTRQLIDRRIEVSKPGWKISSCTETVSKVFKGDQKLGHFAVLSPDGRVRSFANCKGRDQMTATSFWQNITDVLCIKSGTIGLTKGKFLLYSGTDNRLRDVIRPLRDVTGMFEFTLDYNQGLKALVVAQPYRALMITPTNVTQVNGDFSHGAEVKKVEQNRYVTYNIVPKVSEYREKPCDDKGKLDGIDRTTGEFYFFGSQEAENVIQLIRCNGQYVWLDFFGQIHSKSFSEFGIPIESRLTKKKAKAIFAYDRTLYGVMPDNSVEVLYGKDELGIIDSQNS